MRKDGPVRALSQDRRIRQFRDRQERPDGEEIVIPVAASTPIPHAYRLSMLLPLMPLGPVRFACSNTLRFGPARPPAPTVRRRVNGRWVIVPPPQP